MMTRTIPFRPRAERLATSLLSRPGLYIGAILILALIVRLLTIFSLAHLPWVSFPSADSAEYDEMAHQFAAGDLLIGTEPLMSPAYPFLLGGVYRLLGDGPFAIRMVQMLFGLALVVLTWDTTRRLLDHRAALVAATGVALFGPALFYEAQLLSDGPATALAGLALWAMTRAMVGNETRGSRWLLVGLATGVVALFRPNAAVLALPLAAAAMWTGHGRRQRAILVTAAALGFMLGLSPVSLRNLLATGRPTVFAAEAGHNLYVGNGPSANGTLFLPAELPEGAGPREVFATFQAEAERAMGHPLDQLAVDRYWIRRTLAFVFEHPSQTVALIVWKARLFWNGRSISDIEDYDFTRTLDPVLASPFLQWWGLLPLALVGTVLALVGGGPGAIVGLFNLAWFASLVIFFIVDRYRLPALPSLAIAAVIGVWRVRALWAAGSGVTRAALLAMAAVSVLIVWPVEVVSNAGRLWLRLGVGYERAGRVDEARAAYQHALETDPPELRARRRLDQLNGRSR